MVHHIHVKFTCILHVYYRNCYFQSSKTHNSKSNYARLMVLVFYMTSYVALHVCKTSKKIYGNIFKLQKRHKTRITICNVQRVVTPKAGNSVMVLVFCTSHHVDIHLHKVSRKYLEQFSSYRADTYITEITIFNV